MNIPTREEIQAKAMGLLENPGTYPGMEERDRYPILRIWSYPAFDSYRSWSLSDSPKKVLEESGHHWVRRVTWLRDDSAFKYEPRMECKDANVAASIATEILDSLMLIRIPLRCDMNSVSLDGVRFGLHTYGQSNATISWANDPPTEWIELGEWHHRTLELLESLLR